MYHARASPMHHIVHTALIMRRQIIRDINCPVHLLLQDISYGFETSEVFREVSCLCASGLVYPPLYSLSHVSRSLDWDTDVRFPPTPPSRTRLHLANQSARIGPHHPDHSVDKVLVSRFRIGTNISSDAACTSFNLAFAPRY